MSEAQAKMKELQDKLASVDKLCVQIEAYKGELADARSISFQLRTNLGFTQKANHELVGKVKALESELEKMKSNQSAEVSDNELESKTNKE